MIGGVWKQSTCWKDDINFVEIKRVERWDLENYYSKTLDQNLIIINWN